MSPLCTGNSDQKGAWVCPYCKPCASANPCYTLYDVEQGTVEVPCSSPCNRAPFHASSPGDLWAHVEAVHNWSGESLDTVPERLLETTKLNRPRVPFPKPKGPSSAARMKARKRRRQKNKNKK